MIGENSLAEIEVTPEEILIRRSMSEVVAADALLNSVKRHARDTAKKLLPTRLQRRFPYSLFGRKIGDYLENRDKERLFGSFAPLVPRVEDMFDGPRSLKLFKETGEEFLRIYQEICGLRPSEKMLDVGCGIGRKTIPLTHYLTSEATYQGMDINRTGIEWCQEKISAKFANFRFQQVDVYNKFYNPQGTVRPVDYKFPFESETFDFVTLVSVFTHMRPTDGVNYLSEVHRVLRRGGRCLITYFLLTEESLQGLVDGKSAFDFKHAIGNSRVVLREMPEFAIAYEESWLRENYPKVGLKITRLDYGSWCGRGGAISCQDLVLAVKE